MIGFIIVRNVGSWPAKAFVWGRVKQKFTYAFLARFLIKNKQTLHYLKPQNKTTIIKKTLLNEKKKEKTKKKRLIRPETNSQPPRRAISLLLRHLTNCD